MRVVVDVNLLAELIDGKRETMGLSYQKLADLTGVSPSSLSRIKRGQAVDMHDFCSILQWLEMPHRTVIKKSPAKVAKPVQANVTGKVTGVVERDERDEMLVMSLERTECLS